MVVSIRGITVALTAPQWHQQRVLSKYFFYTTFYTINYLLPRHEVPIVYRSSRSQRLPGQSSPAEPSDLRADRLRATPELAHWLDFVPQQHHRWVQC